MEYVAGVVDSVRKWFKGPDTPITLPGWNYETYREYLLAISRGRDYLLPIEDYPSQIELSSVWHDSFNQIRDLPHEGWVLIGYQDGQRRLVMPRVAEKGLSHSVPSEVMSAGINRAILKAGISDYVGDIHSHPRGLTRLGNDSAFSVGDIYGLLDSLSEQRPSDPRRSGIFVAEGNENIAAFGTRGSLERVRNSPLGSYEDFATKWYSRYQWTFISTSPTTGEIAEATTPHSPKIWTINKGIAHHYQLSLYKGLANGFLLRDHPARIIM